MTTYRFTLTSRLCASAAVLWQHASSMDGVNDELSPVRMSAPRGARLTGDTPTGRLLFRSVVSLGGVVPLDLHMLALASIEPGRGFHERSWSLLEARWEHARTITPDGDGCVVEDDLSFTPRVLGAVVSRVAARVFENRHRRLRARFGSAEGQSDVRVTWHARPANAEHTPRTPRS